MILYVRHLAWLNAVPEKKQDEHCKERAISRLKKMQQQGIHVGMPPLKSTYLLNYLFEVGPTLSGSMGESLLTHEELFAWQKNMGIELQPWEIGLPRRLSGEYLNESTRAINIDCPAPWHSEFLNINRAEVSKNLERNIERLMDL